MSQCGPSDTVDIRESSEAARHWWSCAFPEGCYQEHLERTWRACLSYTYTEQRVRKPPNEAERTREAVQWTFPLDALWDGAKRACSAKNRFGASKARTGQLRRWSDLRGKNLPDLCSAAHWSAQEPEEPQGREGGCCSHFCQWRLWPVAAACPQWKVKTPEREETGRFCIMLLFAMPATAKTD